MEISQKLSHKEWEALEHHFKRLRHLESYRHPTPGTYDGRAVVLRMVTSGGGYYNKPEIYLDVDINQLLEEAISKQELKIRRIIDDIS